MLQPAQLLVVVFLGGGCFFLGGGGRSLISAPRNHRYADKYSLQQMLGEEGGGVWREEGIVYVPF